MKRFAPGLILSIFLILVLVPFSYSIHMVFQITQNDGSMTETPGSAMMSATSSTTMDS